MLLPGCAGMSDVVTVAIKGRSGLRMPPVQSAELVECERQLSTWGADSMQAGKERGFPAGSPTIAAMEDFLETMSRLVGQPMKEIPTAIKPMDPVPEAQAVVQEYKREVGRHETETMEYLDYAAAEAAKPGMKTVSITSGMVGWLMRIGGAGFGLTIGIAIFHWIKKRAAKAALLGVTGQLGLATTALRQTVGAIQGVKATQPALYDDGTDKSLKAHLKAAHDAETSALINEIRRA